MHPVGFEPTHLAAPEPESGVYANFTTGATWVIVYHTKPRRARGNFHKNADRLFWRRKYETGEPTGVTIALALLGSRSRSAIRLRALLWSLRGSRYTRREPDAFGAGTLSYVSRTQ